MALSEGARGALPYWGSIQAAVGERATTAQLWEAIRNEPAAVRAGAPLPSFQGVNELRSLAASGRNAGERLQRAIDTEARTGLPQSIDASMMSYGVSSRDAAAIATMAQYHARFEGTFTLPDGSELKQWLTVKFGQANLPATVGELADALAVGVPAISIPAGASLSEVGGITLTVV